MMKNGFVRVNGGANLWGVACLAVALSAGCGSSPVMSGVALSRVGQGLSNHAQSVSGGAEVCALHEALTTPPPSGAEKPITDSCGKAIRSDMLWRRILVVLGAYSERIGSVASRTSQENSGQLDAALTGIQNADWTPTDGAAEQGARDAAAQLVAQIGSKGHKDDLSKIVGEAAPHVKTLCDGIASYLDGQVKALVDAQNKIEKKRIARTDRRCANLDNRPICVSESVVDRLAYATTLGRIAQIGSSYIETRDAVSGFCTAHRKLEEAASSGQLSKDKAFNDVVEALKALPRSRPDRELEAKPTDEGVSGASGKPPSPEKK